MRKLLPKQPPIIAKFQDCYAPGFSPLTNDHETLFPYSLFFIILNSLTNAPKILPCPKELEFLLFSISIQEFLCVFLNANDFQSYDATTHFESTVKDVISMYSQITGKVNFAAELTVQFWFSISISYFPHHHLLSSHSKLEAKVIVSVEMKFT